MWNERYSEKGYAYGDQPNNFLKDHAHRIPKGPVLCIAEGEGRNAVYLATLGYELTAMDASEVGLKNAQKLARDRGVKINTIVADLNDFQFEPEKWSGIVSIWAHVPAELRHRIHSEISRSLVPGGVFILEAYTPDQLTAPGIGGPPTVDLLMTKEEVISELSGLRMDIAQEVTRDVNEGKYHRGESAVLQVLALKDT